MVLAQLFLACILNKEPLKTEHTQELYVVSARDELDIRSSVPLPKTLKEAIHKEIQTRGLKLKALPLDEQFSTQRTSAQRKNLYPQRPLLLIETKAQFFSQLNGRFRWTVAVQLNLISESGTTFTQDFSVPVFHQFHHERESEALEAAQEVILRYLGTLLDDYIRGSKP